MKFFTAPLSLFVVTLSALGAQAAVARPQEDANLIASILNLLNIGLVTHINVNITLDSFMTNTVAANFKVHNPLPIELTLNRVANTAGINSTVYATFDQTFTKFIVPPFSSVNSGNFGNVTLTQGIDGSLDIVPLGFLDIIDANVSLHGATIFGWGGIPVPLIGLIQKNVSTSYNLDLS